MVEEGDTEGEEEEKEKELSGYPKEPVPDCGGFYLALPAHSQDKGVGAEQPSGLGLSVTRTNIGTTVIPITYMLLVSVLQSTVLRTLDSLETPKPFHLDMTRTHMQWCRRLVLTALEGVPAGHLLGDAQVHLLLPCR